MRLGEEIFYYLFGNRFIKAGRERIQQVQDYQKAQAQKLQQMKKEYDPDYARICKLKQAREELDRYSYSKLQTKINCLLAEIGTYDDADNPEAQKKVQDIINTVFDEANIRGEIEKELTAQPVAEEPVAEEPVAEELSLYPLEQYNVGGVLTLKPKARMQMIKTALDEIDAIEQQIGTIEMPGTQLEKVLRGIQFYENNVIPTVEKEKGGLPKLETQLTVDKQVSKRKRAFEEGRVKELDAIAEGECAKCQEANQLHGTRQQVYGTLVYRDKFVGLQEEMTEAMSSMDNLALMRDDQKEEFQEKCDNLRAKIIGTLLSYTITFDPNSIPMINTNGEMKSYSEIIKMLCELYIPEGKSESNARGKKIAQVINADLADLYARELVDVRGVCDDKISIESSRIFTESPCIEDVRALVNYLCNTSYDTDTRRWGSNNRHIQTYGLRGSRYGGSVTYAGDEGDKQGFRKADISSEISTPINDLISGGFWNDDR